MQNVGTCDSSPASPSTCPYTEAPARPGLAAELHTCKAHYSPARPCLSSWLGLLFLALLFKSSTSSWLLSRTLFPAAGKYWQFLGPSMQPAYPAALPTRPDPGPLSCTQTKPTPHLAYHTRSLQLEGMTRTSLASDKIWGDVSHLKF